jgi:hypothetical protein
MREFNLSQGGLTLTSGGTGTLIGLNPHAAPANNLEFLRWWAGQAANATSAQQRVEIVTQVTQWVQVFNVTAQNPAVLKKQDTFSSIISGTAGVLLPGYEGLNSSTEGTGAKTQLLDDAFNVLNGWLNIPTPPETIIMPAGFAASINLQFPVAPASLTVWSIGTQFREV